MLHTDSRAGYQISDDVKPELLSTSRERLRAYYYNNNTTKCCLITPYSDIEEPQLHELIKIE